MSHITPEQRRAWKAANPNKVKESQAKWRAGHREHLRKYLAEYKKAHPERKRAWSRVQHEKERGRSTPQPCAVCGAQNTHAHHSDYGKPLEVTWLCPTHHAETMQRARA